MVSFENLTCNGRVNPCGTGLDILLQWSYRGGGRSAVQTSYEITVFSDGKQVYNSGKVMSDDMQCIIPESCLKAETLYSWTLETEIDGQTLISASNNFETATDSLSESHYLTSALENDPPASAFARDIEIKTMPVSARLYVTGLGFIHASLNEMPVTEARMLPPNTPYRQRCLFESFDITELLHEGNNRLVITVGCGYNMDYSQWGYRYDNKKGIRALIVLRYTDKSEERIVTDDKWYTVPTGFRENSLYGGETFDARVRDDGTVRNPVSVSDGCAPAGVLCPDEMPPVLPVRYLSPVNQWKSDDGAVIFDFGENIAGAAEIELSASAGSEIVLRHSEMIDKNGEMNYKTNRAALATDRYICSGKSRETWSPVFTYHGFRYVKAYGTENCADFEIRAVQFSAESDVTGHFSCSDPTVNRIHKLSVNSMQANHMGIPTDCPVRDERTPCMMDSQMYERSAMLNFMTAYPYYRKWLDDVCFDRPASGNPDWHGDVFSLVRHIMEISGDIRPAIRHYDALIGLLHFYTENWDKGLWTKGYGDWCAPNEGTWESYFSSVTSVETSLMYWDFALMYTVAGLLGRTEDAEWIKEKIDTIRTAFEKECLKEDGSVNGGRQAELCTPLYYGLIDDPQKKACVSARLSKLVRTEGTFDTGAYGTPAIGEALSDNGYVDDYYSLLTQTEYPGYGWQIANGATSLWEQWAYDGSMHSHSHAFYAGADASFYRIFCGIRPTGNGFRHVKIAPNLPERMSFAECTLKTVSGTFRVNVEKISEGFSISLTIPPNTDAEVVFPKLENKDSYALFDGERNIPFTDTCLLGSGTYNFRAVPKRYLDKQVY